MKIFLSSIYSELRNIRGKVLTYISKAGDIPLGMELFGAQPEDPLQTCLKELAAADVVILFVGNQYGSIEPDSGLSFTHLEFREAKNQGKPILALLLKEIPEGLSDISNPTGDQLQRFRYEICNSGLTVDFVSEPDDFPAAALTALRRFTNSQANQIGKFQTFQNFENYFSPLLDENAQFNHCNPLVGREDILKDFESFLDDETIVGVLPGVGGSGKSKLLLELSKQRIEKKPRILFLGPQFNLTTENLKELPIGPICIVLDDAHRLDNLEGLAQTIIGAAKERTLKILMTCRPIGLEKIKYFMRGLPKEKIIYFPQLPELPRKTDAIALAKIALGEQYENLADPLVVASDGNPLIITVGGKLIHKNQLSPELLSQTEQFKNAALDGLLDDIPKSHNETVPTPRLLEILSAIAPIRTGKENAEELIGKVC
jgi:hypothetical protein